MKVTGIDASLYRVPLAKGRVSLTAPVGRGPDAVFAVVVTLATDTGVAGIGFTHTTGPAAGTLRTLIESDLAPLIVGESLDTDRLFAKAEYAFRDTGFAGIAARAYAAIDLALWDAKAKAAGVPLSQLLGNARQSATYFVSDVGSLAHDPAAVVKGTQAAMKQGAIGVRLSVGGGDVSADAERVRDVHDALGDEKWLGVAAAGKYDLPTALALAHFFQDQGVDWFEDPLPATDFAGYAKLAGRMELPLVVGSQFATAAEFYRVIRDGLVRTVRPDFARLGGLTPILKIAAVAEAYHVAVSPVQPAEVGMHLACGLAAVPHADKSAWAAQLFAGGPTAGPAGLTPPALPGLGLTLSDAAAGLRV